MAQRIVLVDDLDGSEAANSVTFALDGTTYEIDLSDDHATELRNDLSRYIQVARTRPRLGSGTTKATVDKEQLDAVRQWARDHGYDVSNRGRIPAHINEAYQKLAHPSKQPQFSEA